MDGQTDTHAGVLYLQSSVEEERWERDVIVITTTTTTTTREKGQSSCKEPHINKKKINEKHKFGPSGWRDVDQWMCEAWTTCRWRSEGPVVSLL